MSSAVNYDYAILRIVPRVEREEFVNAGVILSCPAHDFLEARIDLPEALLRAMAPQLDIPLIRRHLEAVPLVCRGGPGAGPIGALDQRARFHWLTAIRSSVIQTSPAHPGGTTCPAACLERLLSLHVSR